MGTHITGHQNWSCLLVGVAYYLLTTISGRLQQKKVKMPFLTLLTNLKSTAVTADSMVKLVSFIAPHLNKPAGRFNWILETDKRMSKGGPENDDKPFVWLKIEAISNFEDPENVKRLTPLLFNFLETELKMEKDWIIINFYNLQSTHVATKGKTVAEQQ